jgi:hypothetical protein
LCRGSEQITRTFPCRRISLQFSQMRFTLERTFMFNLNQQKTSSIQESFTLAIAAISTREFAERIRNFVPTG